MRYGKEIVQRRAMVEIMYKKHERGPLVWDVCWFRVLPVAVYTRLVLQIGRALDEAEAILPESWKQQFKYAPVGKRRKIMR